MTHKYNLDVLWKGGLLTFCLLAITIAGCDSMSSSNEQLKETGPVVPSLDQSTLSASAIATNNQLKQISRAVAKVLADDDIRQYVYRRVMQRFDGETNVLWMDLNERGNYNLPEAMNGAQSKPWTSLLIDRADAVLGQEIATAAKLTAAINQAAVLLNGPIHLYWVDAEEFDPTRAPWVTFTPIGANPDEITEIVAFDASGETHSVNEQVAESRPVIVITKNERTDSNGNLNSSSRRTDLQGFACPTNDPCDGTGGDDDGGSGGSTYSRLYASQLDTYVRPV